MKTLSVTPLLTRLCQNPKKLRSSGIFVAPREAKRNVGLVEPKSQSPCNGRHSFAKLLTTIDVRCLSVAHCVGLESCFQPNHGFRFAPPVATFCHCSAV